MPAALGSMLMNWQSMREREHGGMANLARRETHIGSIGDTVQDFGHGPPRTAEKMEGREAAHGHGPAGCWADAADMNLPCQRPPPHAIIC
jgi:hypothetical protein